MAVRPFSSFGSFPGQAPNNIGFFYRGSRPCLSLGRASPRLLRAGVGRQGPLLLSLALLPARRQAGLGIDLSQGIDKETLD